MQRIYFFLFLIATFYACQNKTEVKQDSDSHSASSSTAAPNTTAPKTATVDTANLIVPGTRIGPLSLGMTMTALNDAMGKRDSGDAAMGKSLQFWFSSENKQHYLAVYTVNNFDGSGSPPRVKQVQTTAPKYKTSSGLATGATLAQIREQFPSLAPLAYYTTAQQNRVYIFDDKPQGIAFEITVPDSTCTAITVHAAGEDVTKTYLPIHPDLTRLPQPEK